MNERAVVGTLLIVTSVLPAVAYAKWKNPLSGFVLALALQFAGMVAYMKWLQKHKPGTVATVADLTAILAIALIVGAVSLGAVMYQHSGSDGSGGKLLVGLVLGAIMSLISMSIAINAADRLVKK